jgi:hypothetical protein
MTDPKGKTKAYPEEDADLPDPLRDPNVQTQLFAPGAVTQPDPTPNAGEVRAGPGDVGASDAPRTLPKDNQFGATKGATSRIILALGIGVPVVLILAALFS